MPATKKGTFICFGKDTPLSYDLAVFDPEVAPRDRDEFRAWWEKQSEWQEPHSYDDPTVSAARLRSWFMEMISPFPQMNGPFASKDFDSAVTDYSVGKSVIYAAFAWSKAEQAYTTMLRLAGKHGVGFYDVSGEEGEVWLPDGKGGMTVQHSG